MSSPQVAFVLNALSDVRQHKVRGSNSHCLGASVVSSSKLALCNSTKALLDFSHPFLVSLDSSKANMQRVLDIPCGRGMSSTLVKLSQRLPTGCGVRGGRFAKKIAL